VNLPARIEILIILLWSRFAPGFERFAAGPSLGEAERRVKEISRFREE
jgi:hypothetical protein